MRKRLATLALLLALGAPAFGQGCAMCYTGAEASGAKSQKALDRAVMVLLVPVLTFMVGFAGIAYKFRKPREDSVAQFDGFPTRVRPSNRATPAG